MRCFRFLGLVLGAVATAASAQPPDANAAARRLFAERGFNGALVMQDVRSGAVVASATVGEGASDLPLSSVKLLLLASYYENEASLPRAAAPDVNRLIARGADDPGRRLALALREALGSRALAAELARFGFPPCTPRLRDCTTLASTTSDRDWAEAMSLGEAGFRVTPLGLSYFLRAVARDGFGAGRRRIMRPATARRLQAAMMDTVRTGTARGIRERLGNLGAIGGKTGTGPAGPQPYDGLFAGLVFDRAGAPRYTVMTYVRRGGLGGGVAAEISAEMAALMLAGR